MEKSNCQEIFELLESKVTADAFECMINYQDESLTRYAVSSIHQNVKNSSTDLHLRLIKGKKTGFATTNDLSISGIENLIRKTNEVLENNEEDPEMYDLPRPEPIENVTFKHIDESATFDDPEARAGMIQKICSEAKKHQADAYGSMSCLKRSLFVGNNYGVKAFHQVTEASLSAQLMKDQASGFAQSSSCMIQNIEIDRVIEDALWGCLNSVEAKPVEAKAYEVILKPEAVEDILSMLNYMGFFTQAIHENRSFLSGKEGELVFDPNISIKDDAWNPMQTPMPFDFEGAPKKTVPIIENGIFKQMVTDAKYAAKLNRSNTGHALPAPNAYGPIPLHLVLEGEKKQSMDQMIEQCKEGILITRFWYANPSHPKKGIATGLTRDGTFYVKNGKIQHAIKNLRYTDSLVEVLSKVLSTGDTPRLYDRTLAPALHCASMKFTG